MYTSYHQTGIAKFRELFSKKRSDAMSDFTSGVHNGFDDDDMPKDPTEKQMQEFADWKEVTTEEAWHMFRGEQMLGTFALQAIAFGYTPESFKKEFVETDKPPPGTRPEMVEPSKKAKQESMSRLIRKCMSAIYSVNSYSYFRNDLDDNSMHKCINPLHILYSRAQNKWDNVMILVMDQAKVTLLPAAKRQLARMTSHHDAQALERWKSLMDKEQIKQLMDRYHKVAPEGGRPQTEAASSSYRAQTYNRDRDRKGEGKGKIYGHAGRRTWEQTNRYARDWQPPAMNI